MATVLLVILIIICIILIGLILIQRSEGGALGIGGGGGGGGLMSGRGTADMVQKLTAFLGAAFLLVCLAISISFNYQNRGSDPFDDTRAQEELVKDEDLQNKALNPTPKKANDDTPLEDDSVKPAPQETDAKTPAEKKDSTPEKLDKKEEPKDK